MGVEGPLHHLHAWIGGENLQGAIGAAAVDDDDAPGPGETRQGAADVGLLVVGEDQRRDLLEGILVLWIFRLRGFVQLTAVELHQGAAARICW